MSYYNYSIDEQIESLGFVIVHCFDAIMIAEKKLFTNFCTTWFVIDFSLVGYLKVVVCRCFVCVVF